MNGWLKKQLDKVKSVWGKITVVQKIILLSSVVVVIIAIVLVTSISSAPDNVAVWSTPVTDPLALQKIVIAINMENIKVDVRPEGMIYVDDELTAMQVRNLLARENLIPQQSTSEFFNTNAWNRTDFERNIQQQIMVKRDLEHHIEALNEIAAAKVELTIPEKTLFSEDQDPTMASIVLTTRPGTILNRKQVEGLVRLVLKAVPGLQEENLVINDAYSGVMLNDFAGLEDFDTQQRIKEEMAREKSYEDRIKTNILNELSKLYTKDRLSVSVDAAIDFAKRSSQSEEYKPFEAVPDNPNTPYSESVFQPNVIRSSTTNKENFSGTGYNPQGPAGQEGQTPAGYKDAEDLVGTWSADNQSVNYEINSVRTTEEQSPWKLEKISIAVAIDGVWKRLYEDDGTSVKMNEDGSLSRSYTPVPDADLKKIEKIVKDSIGYNEIRGDSVTVETISFDRSALHSVEDSEYRRQKQLQKTIVFALIGVAILIVAFIVFRLISREMERRRRLREEELARQHQAMREAALQKAEEEGIEVEMSVEERARMEMQEQALNLAREHPEDVAQLIRTWLVEE